jgi:phosphoglycolate phosphatase
MSRSFDLIVFDWEGTLGDPLGYVLHVLEQQATMLKFPPFDSDAARRCVVFGLERAVKKLFPTLALHQHERLLHAIQHALQGHHGETCLFPGARKLIACIQQAGIHLAIATNKSSHALQRSLQTTALTSFFPITRCADHVPAKPCPQMLEEIMAIYDIAPSSTLMIGDSVADMEMAEFAHVQGVGVDFYRQHAASLRAAGAVEVFDNYDQLGCFLGLPDYLSV